MSAALLDITADTRVLDEPVGSDDAILRVDRLKLLWAILIGKNTNYHTGRGKKNENEASERALTSVSRNLPDETTRCMHAAKAFLHSPISHTETLLLRRLIDTMNTDTVRTLR